MVLRFAVVWWKLLSCVCVCILSFLRQECIVVMKLAFPLESRRGELTRPYGEFLDVRVPEVAFGLVPEHCASLLLQKISDLLKH